jgi:hypothetical protein
MDRKGVAVKNIFEKTNYEIEVLGFNVLRRELGVTGLIQFIQQFDKGSGNYTVD